MFSPMIDLLVRAAILLIAAWLTTAVARRRSASLRALIWTSALASLLILPVLSRILPSWPIEVWRVERVEAAAGPQVTRVAPPVPVATTVELERTDTIAMPNRSITRRHRRGRRR